MIIRKSPRQKKVELMFVKSLNKTAPGSEREFFELWKTGKIDILKLIDFRNFYTMQGERWSYKTGYQDGYMEDR